MDIITLHGPDWGEKRSWLIVRLLEVDYSVTTLAAGLGKAAPAVAAAVGSTLSRSDRVGRGLSWLWE